MFCNGWDGLVQTIDVSRILSRIKTTFGLFDFAPPAFKIEVLPVYLFLYSSIS